VRLKSSSYAIISLNDYIIGCVSLNYWQGKQIKLRTIEMNDVAFFEGLDYEFDKNVDAIHLPKTKDRTRAWMEREMQPRFGDAFRWVAENAEGQAVGTIDTFACERRNGTFKYGIAVAREYWGQAYAKEMIHLVLRYYFHELGYQKVTPHVYAFNERSLRLHQSLGFVQEGRLRNMVYTDGQYYDEIHFGLTKAEFANWK
jgi:RimJ/RimL family protein N-acetyltransferase